jgi:hypothetical protein
MVLPLGKTLGSFVQNYTYFFLGDPAITFLGIIQMSFVHRCLYHLKITKSWKPWCPSVDE